MQKIELIQGDCMEEMKNISDGKVDIVFTSPPYNMNLRIRNGKYCSRQIVKEISTKYENFDDNLPMEDYLSFTRKVIDECLRISPMVFYNVQFLTGNKVALFKIIGEYAEVLKEVIIWDKVNGQPAIGELILNSQYEVILVFDRNNAISRKFQNGNFNRGVLSNCWKIKRGKKIVKCHGAIFPVELAKKVISNFSKEGETILDPFMGTGTTGIECKSLNRNFIGIEIDPDYFKIAEKRIKVDYERSTKEHQNEREYEILV